VTTAAVLDTLGLFDVAAAFPEQLSAATEAARGLAGLPRHRDVENVVVLGMGGSGAAGDVLLAAAAPYMALPVTVVKSYVPPAFVGRSSLVFAVSFSGDTEETVEAAIEAEAQGANIVVVTGGGELAKLATAWGAPTVDVPAAIPVPRAALGAMAVPLLVVLEDIGLFPGATRWVDLAVHQLRQRRDQLTADRNPAADLARRIGRTIPLVYSSRALGAAAAQRWKKQVNENAKTPAFSGVYPELCHNEIVGWGVHGDVTRQMITVVNLRHDAEHPQTARRFDIVNDILREVVAEVFDVRAEGEGDLAQLLDLSLYGDFVSLHLAVQAGVDPGPTPVLTEIKEKLREG
jgi:glucose/mannose-6-phosphate isomerase